jgi:hypothetical protein
MLLPSKHLSPERCLLGVGADILTTLFEPMTVSRLWEGFKTLRASDELRVPFDWFILRDTVKVISIKLMIALG